MRHGARFGVRIALGLEAVVIVILTLLNLAVVAADLLDGADELFALIAIIVGALLSLVGACLGALGGAIAYQNARARDDLRRRHSGGW